MMGQMERKAIDAVGGQIVACGLFKATIALHLLRFTREALLRIERS
jgi:hypothetical protein